MTILNNILKKNYILILICYNLEMSIINESFSKSNYYKNISIFELIKLILVSCLNWLANLPFGIIIPELLSALSEYGNNKIINNKYINNVFQILNININQINIFICILCMWFAARTIRYIAKSLFININFTVFSKVNQMTARFINQIPLSTYLMHKPGFIQGQIFNLDKNLGVVMHILFEHLLSELLFLVVSLITFLNTSFVLGGLLLLWSILHISLYIIVSQLYMKKHVTDQVITNSKRSGFYVEMCGSFFINKFYNLSDLLNKKVHEEYNLPYLRAGATFFSLNALLLLITGLFAILMIGVCGFGYLLKELLNGFLATSQFTALWMKSIWLFSYVFSTSEHLNTFISAIQTINTGIDFMQNNVSEKDNADAIVLSKEIQSIQCDNVEISYIINNNNDTTHNNTECDNTTNCKHDIKHVNTIQNKEKIIICENLNININQGEIITILGPSGCGKTTLLNLFSGLLKPNKGNVYVNSNNINDMNKQELVKRIVYITQTPILLDQTIEYNIKLGNQNITNEQLDDIVTLLELPSKQTHIGYNGNKLSGGQKQRLSIAIGLAKYNSAEFSKKMILADEIVSNLDIKMSYKVIEYLVKLAQLNQSILIFIDHTQISLKYSTQIILFERSDLQKANIISGTHEHLYNISDIYRDYCRKI